MIKNWCETVSKKTKQTTNNRNFLYLKRQQISSQQINSITKSLKIINNNFCSSPLPSNKKSPKMSSINHLFSKKSLFTALFCVTSLTVNQSVKANPEATQEHKINHSSLSINLHNLPEIEKNSPEAKNIVLLEDKATIASDSGIKLDPSIVPQNEIITSNNIPREIASTQEVLEEEVTNKEIVDNQETVLFNDANNTTKLNPLKTNPTPENDLIAQNIPQTNDQETPQTGEEPRVLVAEVVVEGVEGELEDLVYNVIRTNPGRTTTRTRLQEDTNAIFATGFFSNVNVTPSDTPLGVRITYTVQPNPVLQGVTLETLSDTPTQSKIPPEVIENAFGEQYGEIINLRDLQEGIGSLNQWYSDNGFDLAQIVGTPQVGADGIVTLIIAEGEIEDIQVKYFNEDEDEVEGKTREFIVTREIQLKPGDIFNRNTAQRDLQRVFGLGIFQDVRLSFSPAEDPSKVIVNVEVVEGNTGSIAAGAGISSGSGFFGTISYQQQNLGGNNQTLGAEFQLGERELLFDLSLRDPWIATTPDRTSYTANIFRRRSISLVFDGTDTDSVRTDNGNNSPRVIRTGTGITFNRPLAPDPFTRPDWLVSAGLQYQRVRIENADGDLAPISSDGDFLALSESGQDDLVLVRLNASQDRRNSSLQPTEGSLLSLGMDQSVPIGSGNILFNRVRASYSYYMPVNFLNFDFAQGAQALAFNIQGGTVIGDLPPYEAFVLGGSNSVRGYGEGDLGNGRSYVQATAEYRFPIFSAIGGAVFLDYGTDLGSASSVPGRPAERRNLNGNGYGYGLGFRIQSPVGPIRIDFGVNDNGDNRLHFGIGEKF